MSKETPQNTNEEIDLGSLFVIIGKGFSRLFNFIGSIFKGIFHFFITILLFFKANIIKIGIAALIGVVIGTILELKKDTSFGADMLVQPNFESTQQLYNNIQYYNNLVKQKDSVLLAKTFEISTKEATSLKKFSIEPIKSENDILTSYDELILSIDTLTVKSYSFTLFKNSFTDFDYSVHKIHVEATQKYVFSTLDEVIISSIVKNEYFNKLKKLTNENLNRTDALLRKNLAQTDSLHYLYKKVLLEKAKKESSATNIDLGGKEASTKELELFKTNQLINKDLKAVVEDKAENSEIINVISNFQKVGYEIKGIQNNLAFKFGLLGAVGMVLLLLFLQLNRYLEKYKNKD